jgi:hypothetical protein
MHRVKFNGSPVYVDSTLLIGADFRSLGYLVDTGADVSTISFKRLPPYLRSELLESKRGLLTSYSFTQQEVRLIPVRLPYMCVTDPDNGKKIFELKDLLLYTSPDENLSCLLGMDILSLLDVHLLPSEGFVEISVRPDASEEIKRRASSVFDTRWMGCRIQECF